MEKPGNNKKITVKGTTLFLFLLLVSSAMWFIVSLGRVYEANMPYTVYIKNKPDNIKFTTPDSVSFNLKLKGRGYDLFSYQLQGDNKIEIDFNDVTVQNGEITIPISKITPIVGKRINKNTRIISSSCNEIKFEVDKSAYKCPVKISDNISLAPSYRLVDIEINPSTVWVFGDNAATFDCVYTEPVSYSDLRSDIKLKVNLPSVNGCTYNVKDVDISIKVEPYVRKKIQLPINAVGFPKGYTIDAVPESVSLSFDVSAEKQAKINEKEFKVGIKYDSLHHNFNIPQKVQPLETSAGATNITISPSRVKYLIVKDKR